MMLYSIGEVAEMLDIPQSTLRYYEREGLLTNVKRSKGGIRVYTEFEMRTLKMVDCLKAAGMQLRDIKQFLNWCDEGDKTLQKRRDMFFERKTVLEQQMIELQNTINVIQYKCWYYDTAYKAGTEDGIGNSEVDDLPENVQKGKAVLEGRFKE